MIFFQLVEWVSWVTLWRTHCSTALFACNVLLVSIIDLNQTTSSQSMLIPYEVLAPPNLQMMPHRRLLLPTLCLTLTLVVEQFEAAQLLLAAAVAPILIRQLYRTPWWLTDWEIAWLILMLILPTLIINLIVTSKIVIVVKIWLIVQVSVEKIVYL